MKHLKTALACALLASLTGVGVQAILFLRAATETARGLPGVVDHRIHVEIQALTEASTVEIRHLVDTASTRFGALTRVVDARSQEAVDALARVERGLAPVLANAAQLAGNGAALAADVQDSLDDSYWDVKSVINSAAVAATSISQASEAVRDAAPKVAESVVSIGESSAAIASDVRREVDEATKPKRWWQKLLGPVYSVGRLVAAFL